MPLPFPDFAEPVVLQPLTFDVLPYADFEVLAGESTAIGEVAAASAEVATAAVLAEPLLVLGAGLLAAAAGEAILKRLNKTDAPPKISTRLPSGGRVSGGSFARVNENLSPYGDETNNFPFTGTLIGLICVAIENGAIAWYLLTSAGRVPISSSLPANYIKAPNIVEVHYSNSAPANQPDVSQALVAPGNFTLPSPVAITITSPQGIPTVVTPRAYPSPRNFPGIQPFAPVSPGVLVVSPEIGIAINFNPQSVAIAYFNPAPSETTQPQPPSEVKPYKPLHEACPCPDDPSNVEVLCRVKKLQSDLLDDGYDYVSHSYAAADSLTVDGLPDILDRVELTLSNNLNGKHFQYGNANAPDAAICGWFSFRNNSKGCERIRIPYAVATFGAGEGVDGFSFTATYGALFTAIAYTKKKRPYVDNC